MTSKIRTYLQSAALLAALVTSIAPVGATSITIANANFEGTPVPDWHWVPDWDEDGASYVTTDGWSGAGRVLYLDGGGWVSQNLGYSWAAGEVFTLGIKGNQGWRSGGTFKIQLREADGTVLWDSGTTAVDSTVQNFSWTIDSSAFSGAGVTPGSQLNIRIDCLAHTVFLDDVTLSTALADTTAPTLAGSAMVDNKSGRPVNPGELVTYTVTFSEAMDSATVSASDFDNGGTAAVLIGSPATLDGVNYQIPVVASSTGTLQLRVPVGATMTDLAGNALDTSSAILDDTTIDMVAKAIGVTGGDFEVPYTNGQPGDIPFWFDSNYAYADWQNAAQYSANGYQTALMQYIGGYHGYIYQSLGQLVAETKRLVWSIDQVKGNGTAELRFFYGVSSLYLTGTAPGYVVITGADAADFTVTAQPSTPVVSGGGATTFTVRFAPGGTGARSAALWIGNDDTTDGEDPFIINLSGTGATGPSGYDAWSGGAAFGDDTNGDGVANGLAFLLGAADKDANALARLPAPVNDSGKLVMTFDCLAAAARGSAVLNLQFSNDLGAADPWTGHEVAVPGAIGSFPDTGGGLSFEVSANGGLLHVVATVAASKASADGKLFGRLKGAEN